MKNFLMIISCCTILAVTSCGSQIYMQPDQVNATLESNNLTFSAKSALPNNVDVLNVINSIPGGNPGRIMKLDSGYGFEIKNDELNVTLPYFGRLYNASMGGFNNNAFRFTSKDFKVTKSKNKKGNWVVNINVNDHKSAPNLILEVYKNGGAFLSINANDRQPISYDGYLENTLNP